MQEATLKTNDQDSSTHEIQIVVYQATQAYIKEHLIVLQYPWVNTAREPTLSPPPLWLMGFPESSVNAVAARQTEPPEPPEPPAQSPPRPVPATQRPAAPAKQAVRRPTRKPPQQRPPALTPAEPLPIGDEEPAPTSKKSLMKPTDCDDPLWSTLLERYGEHAHTVHEIMKAWELYHDLSQLLAAPLDDRTSQEARDARACEVAHAAIRFANRFEGVCSGRHHSWYLHLFVYVVPRQIEKYGALWPFSTAALESRGARIKRVKVSWRSYCDVPKECKTERAGRVAIFKRSYKSAPTIQILRMVAAAEELYHSSGKGRGAARLKATGRFKRVKIEADHSSTDSYEMDPFKALSSFLADAEVQAGSQ